MAAKLARMSFALYDDRGGGGTFLTHAMVDDAQTLAQANTALAATATALSTVSTAGIKGATFSLINTALAVEPAGFADSNISAGAVIDFDNAADPSISGLLIPSWLDGLLLPDGTIDRSNPTVAAFVTTLIDAVMGGTYTNRVGVANRAAVAAFLSDRKRKRRIR